MGRQKEMVEAEWLTCRLAGGLLECVRQSASPRQLRLFAVACCRRYWDHLTDKRSRASVELADRMAEVKVNKVTIERVDTDSLDAFYELCEAKGKHGEWLLRKAPYWFDRRPQVEIRWAIAALYATHPDAWRASWVAESIANLKELAVECDLVRDIFGNPFRPVAVAPAWLAWDGGVIPRMVQAVYDERSLPDGTLDSARLAVLADALEEAGCTSEDILGHCRSAGPHVRGCWVVDLLAGR